MWSSRSARRLLADTNTSERDMSRASSRHCCVKKFCSTTVAQRAPQERKPFVLQPGCGVHRSAATTRRMRLSTYPGSFGLLKGFERSTTRWLPLQPYALGFRHALNVHSPTRRCGGVPVHILDRTSVARVARAIEANGSRATPEEILEETGVIADISSSSPTPPLRFRSTQRGDEYASAHRLHPGRGTTSPPEDPRQA